MRGRVALTDLQGAVILVLISKEPTWRDVSVSYSKGVVPYRGGDPFELMNSYCDFWFIEFFLSSSSSLFP